MGEARRERRPGLIVVAGRPGSGKTTLAHRVARGVRCPAICRDEIKEGLVNAAGEAAGVPDDAAARAYVAFFDAVELLLRRGVTLVAEAAFQHKLWAPKVEPLMAIADVRVVVCVVDPAVARARHVSRAVADPARERFHPDEVVRAAREGREPPPLTTWDPPRLGVPTLEVDTTDGYRPSLEVAVAFAAGSTSAAGKGCDEDGDRR